jgi:D-3-phosphoglycerate dehydrogenase / 2-oxoglutarate reductase
VRSFPFMPEPLPLVIGLGVVDPGLVAEPLQGRCRFVADPTDADLRDAQGAIARADATIDTTFLNRAPRLRVIGRTGVGVERIDLDAVTARGIAVVVTPGTGSTAVAEGAIAMVLHLVKRLGRLTHLVRSGRWADRGTVVVGDLAGSTLGVVGFGRIGQHTATLGAALGMKVLAYDPVATPPDGLRCSTLEELLSRSDVVTLHLPLTPETHHLLDAERLALTRPGAILVNCSRGALIDNDAAHQALVRDRLGGIGLDVFDPEPPEHHPLFDHPDVVLSPHLMGLSAQATAATFTAAATGVVDVLEGREPAAVANPAWKQAAVLPGSPVASVGGLP